MVWLFVGAYSFGILDDEKDKERGELLEKCSTTDSSNSASQEKA